MAVANPTLSSEVVTRLRFAIETAEKAPADHQFAALAGLVELLIEDMESGRI